MHTVKRLWFRIWNWFARSDSSCIHMCDCTFMVDATDVIHHLANEAQWRFQSQSCGCLCVLGSCGSSYEITESLDRSTVFMWKGGYIHMYIVWSKMHTLCDVLVLVLFVCVCVCVCVCVHVCVHVCACVCEWGDDWILRTCCKLFLVPFFLSALQLMATSAVSSCNIYAISMAIDICTYNIIMYDTRVVSCSL